MSSLLTSATVCRNAFPGRTVLESAAPVAEEVAEKIAEQWRHGTGDAYSRIPYDRMRYALDIPFIARESSPAEIPALKTAWAAAAN